MISVTGAIPVATRTGPREVAAALTGPAGREALGVVVLFHGFTRGPHHLRGIAEGLAESGVVCLRPRLASLRRSGSFNDAEFVTALAMGIADRLETREGRDWLDAAGLALPDRSAMVLAGHSAGAAVAIHQAAVLQGRSGGAAPAGLLLLDGTDTVTGLAAAALPSVDAVPLRLVAGPPTRCNRHGELLDRIAARRRGPLGVRVVAGGHGDAEDAAGPVYRMACGDRTAAEDRRVVHRLAVVWAVDLLTGSGSAAGHGAGDSDEAVDAWLRRLADDGRLVPITA